MRSLAKSILLVMGIAAAGVLLYALLKPQFDTEGTKKTVCEEEAFDGSVSVSGLLRFLRERGDVGVYSKIDIQEKYLQGETFYFAALQQDFFWSAELYLIRAQEGKIAEVIATGAGGLESVFEYDLIDISQGKFIAAYCASHAGNGDLELIPLNSPGAAQYSIPAVDCHYEDTEETANEYGVPGEMGSGSTASSVYRGGKLEAAYADVDGDGHTDIVLSGVQQIFAEEDGEWVLRQEHFVENVFLFDAAADEFALDSRK